MKLLLSRSLFAAFMVVAGVMSTYAQTTVTLPTIPCSNCNGPGAFATTAPACTPALVGAPLTISWGAATGATTYTIMIATDAALSQNVATFTLTGTTISVPALALMPSTTYYWTVFANNATGSTKATGGVCSFITNTTWTGTTPTSGFPTGTNAQQVLNSGIAGGYFDCRSGDGTCASGDNMICNPSFQFNADNTPFLPYWIMQSNLDPYGSGVYIANGATTHIGSILSGSGAGVSPSGTTTGLNLPNMGSMVFGQQVYENNPSSAPVNYQISFYAKWNPAKSFTSVYILGGLENAEFTTNSLTNTWTQYVKTVSLPAGKSARFVNFNVGLSGASVATSQGQIASGAVFITDMRLCKL